MSTDDILTERLHRAEQDERRTATMSETTLTKDEIQAIRQRPVTRVPLQGPQTVELTRQERDALCDAAARAETLAYENHLLRRGHDDDRAEVDRLQAQLTEVTRERDEARILASLAETFRDDATKAEAALAPLRAVVEAARRVIYGRDGLLLTGGLEECEARAALQHALSALPADPPAPTPR